MADPGVDKRLRDAFTRGLTADDVALRKALGVDDPEAGEWAVVRALVNRFGQQGIAEVRLASRTATAPDPLAAATTSASDSSFLGRLLVTRDHVSSSEHGGVDDLADAASIDILRDVRTLVAVARAGNLGQRRAAVLRLAELVSDPRSDSRRPDPTEPTDLRSGRAPASVAPPSMEESRRPDTKRLDVKKLAGDEFKLAARTLVSLRDVEIAYELAQARTRVPGAEGRQARAERNAFRKLVDRVMPQVAAYWEGTTHEEPVTSLAAEERAMLLLRVRSLPDTLIDHISALLEGADDTSGTVEARRQLLSLLRFAGDPRLVPALVDVLRNGDTAEVVEAGRALGYTDDPRVPSALFRAYERAVGEQPRLALAGALGRFGDRRGAAYVRECIGHEDPVLRLLAVEALASVGGPEDVALADAILEARPDVLWATQALRSIARIGDARALGMLQRLSRSMQVSALRAELEDAVEAIKARVELRGEETENTSFAVYAQDDEKPVKTPFGIRIRAFRHYFMGHFFLLFGMVRAGIRRLELAAAIRTGWGMPLISMGMVLLRRNRYARALSAFRQALEVDRTRVERSPILIRAVARCFLTRAEQVESQGRHEIAKGLLDEVLALDLRRAPSAIRIELSRRHEALRQAAIRAAHSAKAGADG